MAQIAEIRVYGCDIPEHIIFTGDDLSVSETEITKDNTKGGGTTLPDADQRLPSTPGKPVVKFKKVRLGS